MKKLRPRSYGTIFPIGSEVEVSSNVDGFKGSWFTAKVTEPPPLPATAIPPERRTRRAIFVEYQTLLSDDGSKLLAEFVDPVYVRPLPPLDPDGHTFEVNDVVDAWHLDGWWIGVVVEVWEESSNYSVCFEEPPEIIELKRSELRTHWDWDGCQWVRPRKKKIWQKYSGTGSSKRKKGGRETPLAEGSEDASVEKAARLSDTGCTIRDAEMDHVESPSSIADTDKPISMWVNELHTPTVSIGKSVMDVVSAIGKQMKQTSSIIDETLHSPLKKPKVDIQLKEGRTGSRKIKTVHRKPLSKGKNCDGANGTVKEMKQNSSLIGETFHFPSKEQKMDIQLKEGGTGSLKRKTVHRKSLCKGKNCNGATGTVDKLAVKDHIIVGVESSENTGESKAMPPKHARTKTLATYDEHRFVSQAAAERFKEQINRKHLVPERGFEFPDSDQFAPIEREIARRHWLYFCAHPEAALGPIVREFYANVPEHDHGMILVRGRPVNFSAEAINRYYRTPQIIPDEYTTYLRDHVNYSEIISFLCKPGTEWTLSRGEPVTFKSNTLNHTARIWYHFLCAKMLPSSHVSTVSRDRAILLYCLLRGMSIDIGHLLFSNIEVSARNIGYSMFYPSLITSLCKEVRVRWTAEEGIQLPKGPLDQTTMMHIRGWQDTELHHQIQARRRAAPHLSPSSSSPGPSASYQAVSTSAQPPRPSVPQTLLPLQTIADQLQFIVEQMRVMQDDQRAIQAELCRQAIVQAQFMRAVEQSLRAIAHQVHVPPTSLPLFPFIQDDFPSTRATQFDPATDDSDVSEA